jgi:hypothetical protein
MANEVEDQEYLNLLLKGRQLFHEIGHELNTISNQHLRSDDKNYRRKLDHDEICVALALMNRKMIWRGEKS